MEEWDDAILSELSDSAFDLPPLEFEDDDEEEEGECSSGDSDNKEVTLDDAINPNLVKKKFDILVEIDEDHKKIVSLRDSTDDLRRALFKVISNDPELNEYVGAKVMFKVYNAKFNTWVDHDTSKEIIDGMRLKAVFQRRHTTNSHKVHRRHKHSRKRYHSDSSDDYPYKKKFIKYRKEGSYGDTRKWKKEMDNSDENRCRDPTRNHDLIHNELGPEFESLQDNSCEFEKTQFYRHQDKSTSYKFHHVIQDEDYPEEEDDEYDYDDDGDDTEEIGNQKSSKSVEECAFSEGDVYRMSLGLTNKNPISALHELCNRLKWRTPKFELRKHCTVGPINHFWMQVTVNGIAYSHEVAERKKQLAKASAAQHCLQKLGVFK